MLESVESCMSRVRILRDAPCHRYVRNAANVSDLVFDVSMPVRHMRQQLLRL